MGGFGFQNQGYGMSHDAQEQSYAMNQESSWQTPNKYHHHQGHASGMPSNMYPQNQAMLHNSKQNGYWDGGSHHSMGLGLGGKRMPTYSGGGMSNNHDQMENSKYERFHEEVIHVPAGASRVQEMMYERSSWGDDFGRNNYRGSVDDGINWKRNGGQQFEWKSKGV